MLLKFDQFDQFDSFDLLRSFPLSGLKKLGYDHDISILNGLAHELACELVEHEPNSTRISISDNLNMCLIRVDSITCRTVRPQRFSSEIDILVSLDKNWSAGAVKNTNLLRNICTKVQGAFLFPIHFDWEPVRVIFGNGFSWIESNNDNKWVWCDNKVEAKASMTIVNSTEEVLSAKLSFSCPVAFKQPTEIKIVINEQQVYSFPSNKECEVRIQLHPGTNEILWSADEVPVTQPGRPRSLSFAVMNFHMLDLDGIDILSKETIYEPQECDDVRKRQSEVFVRKQLHRSGFVSVSAMICGSGVFCTSSMMVTTSGSPSLPIPYDEEKGGLYQGGKSIPKHSVAWVLASPLAGKSFDALRTGLFFRA